jgi:hypothetical protein
VERGCGLEVFVEPGDGAVVGARGVGAFEAVAGARDGLDFGGDSGGDEALDDPQGLLIGDVGIGGAVDGERGRCVGSHPVDRAGAHVDEALVIEIAAEEFGEDLGRIDGLGVRLREIGGTVFVDHALDGARLIAIGTGAFELGDAGGEAEHEDEMSAGAAAEGADVGGVEIVFGGVGAEKADGGLDVFDRGGKLMARRKAIVGGGGDIAVFGEFDGESGVAFFVAGAESAAVDEEDGGARSGRRVARADHIKCLAAADRGVFDVALGEDGVGDFGLRAESGDEEREEKKSAGMHCGYSIPMVLNDGPFAVKARRRVPFEFVLEAIAELSPRTNPMFGCLAVYVGAKIVLILRDRPTGTADNGVWLATTVEHHASLRREFPKMRSIQVFGKDVTGWQVLPADAPDFEEMALRACELVLAGDARIGKVPGAKRKRK